jgi:hypothetical protein
MATVGAASSTTTRTGLKEVLAAGPCPAAALRQDATAHGIGEKALSAARKSEDITVSKDRVPQGRRLWMLTPSAGDHGEDGTPTSP